MDIIKKNRKDERRILIAMIVDSVVLGRISGKWDKRGLFKTKWANVVGKWCMNQENIAWANKYLLDMQSADLWIVDEIGPYETEQGLGWADILPLLPDLPARKVLVTFRTSLLPWFLEHYPTISVVHLGESNPEATLMDALFSTNQE